MENIEKVKVTIDGQEIIVPKGTTVLEAAKMIGIKIPTLCYLKNYNVISSCRVCVVEVEGIKVPVPSCSMRINNDGMKIRTNTEAVLNMRKMNLNKILKDHNKNCLSCKRNTNCALQCLASEMKAQDDIFSENSKRTYFDDSNPYIVRDDSKCILCNRCNGVCTQMQTVNAICKKMPFNNQMGTPADKPLKDTFCVGCGQCTLVCPVAALTEKSNVDEVLDAIKNPDLITVVAPAPSVRVAIAEEFGGKVGEFVQGQLVTSLKMLGFDHVFDIDMGADLTIMEEAAEFVDRLTNGGLLPMFTSCCPGWTEYLTAFYPDFIPNLSSTKSPQQIFGAALKTYWAKKNNIDPKKIFFVTVMPCIAKKGEILRGKNAVEGVKDVDASITVREYAKLLKSKGIDLPKLKESEFDKVMGDSSGAAVIFGATGGVMEAALRTVADTFEGKSMDKIDYNAVRGTQGIKEATINVAGKTVNVCVASGLKNAQTVLESIKTGAKKYDFVEIMACPGGCVNGGGMPIHDPNEISFEERAKLRAKSLYTDDERKTIRKSHLNPDIIALYKDYYEKPNSHLAHENLHTVFKKREIK